MPAEVRLGDTIFCFCEFKSQGDYHDFILVLPYHPDPQRRQQIVDEEVISNSRLVGIYGNWGTYADLWADEHPDEEWMNVSERSLRAWLAEKGAEWVADCAGYTLEHWPITVSPLGGETEEKILPRA